MKEKIILGKYKFVGNQNSDEFIDIELNREIESLKKDFLYNTFDFQEQFIKERNNSLKFCLYGIVESRYGHCDNLNLKIKVKNIKSNQISTNANIFIPYINPNATSGYSFNVLTKPLSSDSNLTKNIYGTNKGCYFFHFEINRDDYNSNKEIEIEIFDSSNELYGQFTMPFIFFDSDKQPVEFGTESADFNNDNQIETINNNFPFFFDKHWIKFNLEPHGPQIVFFENSEMRINENDESTLLIPVTLNEPSKYGLEKVKIAIDYNTDSFGLLLTEASLGLDFQFDEQVLSWEIGEKTKYIKFNVINDLQVENVEKIQFRIVPLLNSRIDVNSNHSMVLYIDSDDVPVTAFFTLDTYETYRPLIGNSPSNTNPFFSTFNTISASAPPILTIRVNFSSPLTVPGETITIKYNDNSSAKVFYDFSFNEPKSEETEIKINVPLSASSVTFQMYLKGQIGYSGNEVIILDLIQSSLGIIPVSQSNANSYPQIKITLKDSTLPASTRFVLPINKDAHVGIFKTIFVSNDYNNKHIILEKNSLDLYDNPGKSQQYVTDDFTCSLEIKNDGEKIFYDNKDINPGDTFTIKLNLSSITENIVFDLPANADWKDYYYKTSKYNFRFIDVPKTYPKNATSIYDDYNSDVFEITKPNTSNKYDSGLSGTNQYFLTTEIYNAFSTFNITTNECTQNASNLNVGKVMFNGAILSKHNFFQRSTTYIKFLKKIVSEECYDNNNTLPIGINTIPSGPYNEKYCHAYFGETLIQSQFDQNQISLKMLLERINGNLNSINPFRSFNSWNNTKIETKTNLILEVINMGAREVVVLNKKIPTYQSAFFNNTEVDFSNLSLFLQSNHRYNSTFNRFDRFKYRFRLHNVKIPVKTLGAITFNTISDFDICDMDMVINSSNNIPVSYFLENKYNNMGISGNAFGTMSCSPYPSLSPTQIYKNILINNVLVFSNTGSFLTDSNWKSSKIHPDCIQSPIPFKVV